MTVTRRPKKKSAGAKTALVTFMFLIFAGILYFLYSETEQPARAGSSHVQAKSSNTPRPESTERPDYKATQASLNATATLDAGTRTAIVEQQFISAQGTAQAAINAAAIEAARLIPTMTHEEMEHKRAQRTQQAQLLSDSSTQQAQQTQGAGTQQAQASATANADQLEHERKLLTAKRTGLFSVGGAVLIGVILIIFFAVKQAIILVDGEEIPALDEGHTFAEAKAEKKPRKVRIFIKKDKGGSIWSPWSIDADILQQWCTVAARNGDLGVNAWTGRGKPFKRKTKFDGSQNEPEYYKNFQAFWLQNKLIERAGNGANNQALKPSEWGRPIIEKYASGDF
jgi:hypothetical protein